MIPFIWQLEKATLEEQETDQWFGESQLSTLTVVWIIGGSQRIPFKTNSKKLKFFKKGTLRVLLKVLIER